MFDRHIAIFAPSRQGTLPASNNLPPLITKAGERATCRFLEFFTVTIRNRNTREAYARAVWRFFTWCDDRGLTLSHVEPMLVSLYIEELAGVVSAPTVKQHLAAIRMLFDWLVTGQILPMNPAASVRGPKHVVKRGKTPVLIAEEARQLLDAIDPSAIAGLRDRAILSVMIYSFARVGAVVAMNVDDFTPRGRRMWFRLHEKGGKYHEVPAHHSAEEYVDAYLRSARLEAERKAPLFRTLDRRRRLTGRRMQREEVLAMVKRRARQAGLSTAVCCHTFRATGITAYLANGGTLENAQRIAAHESPRTTSLYDRTGDEVSLDEIERILI
ncbi:MAG: tyrosine-type recombinase/integrase [Candidatus Peribacteraceae bacterium]|nr:tyrosine-type recombinase/integrase [Candidatus Peribacteraceae bacterium]